MFERILVAWDGSRAARRALDHAVSLARRFDSQVVAAAVAHSPAHAETEADRRESVEASRRFFEERFEQVRDRGERAGVPIRLAVIEGDHPADDLAAYARLHGFDLIVVGHHRSRRVARLFLHGLVERLVEVAEMPVLVVGGDER